MQRQKKKRPIHFLLIILTLLAIYCFFSRYESPTGSNESNIGKLFEQKLSDVPVEGMGRVLRILPDDKKGLPHQRFILVLPSGSHVLIAHNIAIAPKIPGLYHGAKVYFKGVYEWNSKGGVVHWTHKDPRGKHPDGWLEFNGTLYQ